ncbi:acyl-CoA thioesterase [Novosphingobium profundi]|uniref:acyl-CoA thioesterase n=1 Tax=Novosphingobium profundi TaxID=1774954 RepID=UPI001BDA4945|nr:acyl-CoA thioesterase [Novosphingobium profundi]MBT0668877.1 acyl-CoA thioesterase [Novosphingobium profundi]
MAKPDPRLLDAARYPFHCEIAPRFADLDLNHHVNNVAIAAYVEDARVRFYRASGLRAQFAGLSTMVVSLNIEYLRETDYPAPVSVYCALERLGTTSMTMVHVLTQDGAAVAFSRCVTVAVNGEGKTVPLPEGLDDWMLRP